MIFYVHHPLLLVFINSYCPLDRVDVHIKFTVNHSDTSLSEFWFMINA